jgi:hypothetical protein
LKNPTSGGTRTTADGSRGGFRVAPFLFAVTRNTYIGSKLEKIKKLKKEVLPVLPVLPVSVMYSTQQKRG